MRLRPGAPIPDGDHAVPGTSPATPPQALAGLLRSHAAGLLADTAAVDLLIGHRYWLASPVFTALPCSGSEADMLRIAASLGADRPVTLREVLGCLDETNIAAVAAAITAANGTK